MKKGRKGEQRLSSIAGFERRFLPNLSRTRASETPTDSRALGISFARESLEKIRRLLSK